MDGQVDLFDLLAPSDSHERIWCEFCRSNWGNLKPTALARLKDEHREVEPGRCAQMVKFNLTEPYYAPGEYPWKPGCIIQYPRPKGYGGLYQQRAYCADRELLEEGGM